MYDVIARHFVACLPKRDYKVGGGPHLVVRDPEMDAGVQLDVGGAAWTPDGGGMEIIACHVIDVDPPEVEESTDPCRGFGLGCATL